VVLRLCDSCPKYKLLAVYLLYTVCCKQMYVEIFMMRKDLVLSIL